MLAAQAHAGEQALAYGVVAAAAARGRRPTGDASLRSRARRACSPSWAGAADGQPRGTRCAPALPRGDRRAIADSFAPSRASSFVDDLQWCDPASLDALGLPRAPPRRGTPLLLLGARRTDEPDPDHRYARSPTLGERLGLGRLDARRTSSASRCEPGLDEQAGEAVYRESEGLPLFVAELLVRRRPARRRRARAVVEARLDAVGETRPRRCSARRR